MAENNQEERERFCKQLSAVPFLSHKDETFYHGRGYSGPIERPQCLWNCKKPPRDDHSAPSWLTASEYQDKPNVLQTKCKILANLIRMSRKTVLYTGAGISASVIGQAARSGQNKVGWKANKMQAQPTFTHQALAHLGKLGLVHSWVQQNHDGLPQKAGFPQERINEIHGSWFDPGNPVVKYSGSLHNRAFPWMEEDADTADLVLVIGTSLGGLNADQVATETARRSLIDRPWEASGNGGALGTVIINLQQTAQDDGMTLRIFGKSDLVLSKLIRELDVGPVQTAPMKWENVDKALVPYDREGKRLPHNSTQPKMWLDFSDRAKVKLTPGHNIQGAKQPIYMHIGANKPYKGRPPGRGHGVVLRRESTHWKLSIDGAGMRLGVWWLESAQAGSLDFLPVVNIDPKYESVKTKNGEGKCKEGSSATSLLKGQKKK